MKLKIVWIAALVAALLGCGQGTGGSAPGSAPAQQPTAATQGSFTSVSPAEAKRMIETRQDLLLIDVRSPQELKEGSIKGSTLIPFFDVMRGKHNLPMDKPIMLVCAVGGRSYAAGQMLAAKGYREIYNLSGGLSAWKQAGYPVEYGSPQ